MSTSLTLIVIGLILIVIVIFYNQSVEKENIRMKNTLTIYNKSFYFLI
jgi:tetrahydromethanopterin S-methyltransferase subunit E